jgi:hypothetical protein
MKNIIIYSIVLTMFLSMASVSGQPAQVQKTVAFETSLIKTFKVSCDVEIEDLSQLDLVYLEAKPTLLSQTEFVIKNNKLSIIRTYPQTPHYEGDYEFQMGKSIVDIWGTRLYTHDGEEYYNLPNEEENENFILSQEEIETYGFFNAIFDVSIDEMQAYFSEIGAENYRWGQKIVVIHTEETEDGIIRTEAEMDLEHLYFETRLFKNEVHTLSNRSEYQKIDDNIIPIRSKHIYYSELPNGTLYQITQIEQYLSYQVIDENGNILTDYTNPFGLQITPNPALDSIWINFSIPINEDINVQILDATNNIVLDLNEMVSNQKLFIDISMLEPGIYAILCTYKEETALAMFSKNGIGEYDNPDITTINLQITPNPATNNIDVVFPMEINAVMSVKIMNMMGYTFINEEMYISGNYLPIDIHSLPFGIYYIVCTNEDGTAYTKFLKQ